MSETTRLPRSMRLPRRLSSSIRWDEVLVLQGAPMIGASLSIGALSRENIFALAIAAVGSCCLVAHVYALNDWSGIYGDLKDSNRAARTFPSRGVHRTEILGFAIVLLALSLLLFAALGTTNFYLALTIAALSALYSGPAFHLKGHPFFNSLLHFAGGNLHFQLGYATFAAIDARAVAIGCFFGLVFTAGHLTHETRDCEADLNNGIRTNAVAFGKMPTFVASITLFTASFALLVTLALGRLLPRPLVLAGALYPVQLFISWRAICGGLSFESLSRLQKSYRWLYAFIGVMIVAALRLT